jgi:hypothetical protein
VGGGRIVQPLAMRLPFLILAAGALGGCASTPRGLAPSLAPRAAESIDPRLPVVANVVTVPAGAAVVERLAELLAAARAGDAPFRAAAGVAERLAGSAGSSQGEGWILAQQALSAAVAARAPTTRALGDIDAIGGAALEVRGGLSPADLAAIEQAGAELAALDRMQAARLRAIQARLGGG